MAGRTGAVLQEGTEEAVSQDATGERYHYLPWVDLICAGVPCQDVSVAGKRAGLAGARTGLFYDFARILQELRPTWFVFENVPGLLSSNRGRDFAEVLRVLMVECGYGVCWRVLNSQFFGVAQRRRRLFIVGRFGEPCPAEVLFEPKGSARNSEASGQTWSDLANSVTSGIGRVGSRGADDGANIVASTLLSGGHPGSNAPGRRREDDSNLVAAPLTASYGKQIDSSDRNGGPPNLVATLNSGGNGGGFRTEPGECIVIQDVRGGTRDKTDHGQGIGIREGGPCYTLSKTEQHAVAKYVSSPPDSLRVRDFTGLPKGLDSARYRALGNAVTVQVAEWIGRRILKCHQDLR